MSRRFRRAAAGFALLVGIALPWSGAPAHAGGAGRARAGGLASRQEAIEPFSPEAEAKLKELLGKIAEVRRTSFKTRLQQEREELGKVTGVTAETQNALEPAAKAAVEASTAEWMERCEVFLRRVLSAQRDQVLQMIDQAQVGIASVAEFDIVTDYTPPADRAEWLDALKKALPPEQWDAWQKVRAERSKTALELVEKILKPRVPQMRMTYEAPLLAKAARLKLLLGLDPARADSLKKLAHTASEQFVEGWRKRAVQMLLAMSVEQRRQLEKNSANGFALPDEDNHLEQQTLWQQQVEALLTPEEIARWRTFDDERRARRVHIMGQVMIEELDQQIAFTIKQREQLEPFAERAVKTDPSLFPEDDASDFVSYSPRTFFTLTAKVTDQELAPVLDATQRERWKKLGSAEDENDPMTMVQRRRNQRAVAQASAKGTPAVEPEEVENALSDFLFEKTADTRQHLLKKLFLQVEDASRVSALEPERVGRLQSAARGATEACLVDWKRDTDINIRQNLGDVSPQTLRQRLLGLQDYSVQRESGTPADQQPLWKAAVEAELTDAQRQAWTAELDARKAYRSKVMTGAVVAEFDRQTLLTASQWSAIETRVETVLKDYLEDMSGYFSSNTPWYLQTYYKFVPVAGIPEKELATILTKEQIDEWRNCREYSVAESYWTNIQRMHASRAGVKR